MSRIITLTTDFGLSDPFVGIMKGVILGIAPEATLVDLTHDIGSQNVMQAAYVLKSALPYFPKGTIHVVVVDPGVGTARRPLLVDIQRAHLVGPDNGVLTPGLTSEAKVYALSKSDFFKESELVAPQVRSSSLSQTFHGRDVFAPAAAWLARGSRPGALGHLIKDPRRLDLPQPTFDGRALQGQVVYCDRFGNLFTNLNENDVKQHFPDNAPLRLQMGAVCITAFVRTYAEGPDNVPSCLFNSWNVMEIFIRNRNARQTLGAEPGIRVVLRPA